MKRPTDKFKFGAHQFLWKSHWTDEDLCILDVVCELGLSAFEVSLGDDVRFDRQRLRHHAEALGIEMTAGPGNVWPKDCDISDDDAHNRQLGLTWHRKTIEQAAELGAVAYCGAMYGHPGRVCYRRPPGDELLRAAENLHLLAIYSAELGVRLVIEPMSRFRVHLVNTSEQVVNLVKMASHPNLLVNLDTFHMITEERDYGTAIHCAAALLWGIHACENDRGVPGGGLVPWPAVFGALCDLDRSVRVMMESYNTGPNGFGVSRGIFRDICPDATQFVREGLSFLMRCAANAV